MASVLQLELEPLLWEKLSVYLSSCIIFTGRLQSGLFFFFPCSHLSYSQQHTKPQNTRLPDLLQRGMTPVGGRRPPSAGLGRGALPAASPR